MNDNNESSPHPTPAKPTSRRSPWRIAARITAWTAAIILALVLLLLCGMSWILTPQRLTPLLRDQASRFIEADIDLVRAELTVWRTFPHIYIDLDTLTLRSRAFRNLPPARRQELPAYADTLVHVDRLHGGINLTALLAGRISLYDLGLTGAQVNIVALDSTTVNYDIAPPSEPKPSEPTGAMPDITVNRFEITDSLPVRYFSAADSIDITAVIRRQYVVENNDNAYRISLNTGVGMSRPQGILARPIDVELDGGVKWNHRTPERLALDNFLIGIADGSRARIATLCNAELDFGDPMTVTSFDIKCDSLTPADIMAFLPNSVVSSFGEIETDARMSLSATLLKPYRVTDTVLPWVEANLVLPTAKAVYDRKYTVDRISADITATIPSDIDATVIRINDFSANGMGAAISLHGEATTLVSDPSFDGDLSAKIDLGRLPQVILTQLPPDSQLSGVIDLDTKADLRMSDLSMEHFHRMLLSGRLDLTDLRVDIPEFDTRLYTHRTRIDLGTANSFVTQHQQRIDSLLTASFMADTISGAYAGMDLAVSRIKFGAGCLNRPPSADSTVVMPFGASLHIGRLRYTDADSTVMRAGTLDGSILLRRFEQQARLPQLDVNASAASLFFTDRASVMMLANSAFRFSAHKKPRRTTSLTAQQTDSLRQARRRMNAAIKASLADYDVVDLGVDSTMRRMLRQWNVSGNLKAERGGMFTPYFPLRNRLRNFDMTFTTDSVAIHDVRCEIGRSDITVNGSVTGIQRALAGISPFKIDWRLDCDTLDINELTQAGMLGSAYAEKVKAGMAAAVTADNQDDLDALAAAAVAEVDTMALLVPVNIEAKLDMTATRILYADMAMRDFRGQLLVNDGAINLRDLSARTDIGSATMSALYSAPTKRDIRFGFGAKFNDVDLKQLIAMMPAVDSIMPLLKSFEGIVNADIAATTGIDSCMNIMLPTLDAAIKLQGSDLVLLDAETFRTISKWLMFKNKKVNIIPHMEVEMIVRNSTLELFPFVFDFDRYRLAVMGSNDLDLNFKYHISVLKSPMPFKFGINLSGNPEDMKVRLGGAKYKPGKAGESIAIVDTTRVNLLNELDRIFRSGARRTRLGRLNVGRTPEKINFSAEGDTLTPADSTYFRELLPAPAVPAPDTSQKNRSADE